MHRPMTLTFRRVARSAEFETSARNLAEKLSRSNRRISGCHIILEGSPDGQAGPVHYSVRIHLSLPGAEIHAGSTARSGRGHHDGLAALRQAHGDAIRQLDTLQHQASVANARGATASR